VNTAATRDATTTRGAPEGLPRLLSGYQPESSMGLDEHLACYGPPPWRGAARRGGPLITTLEAAGLRGKGGASFPTARKMRAVVANRSRAVVVANGSEGEPLSAKDRLLLTSLPHLVLDGAVLAAEAVGADEVVIAIDRGAPRALANVSRAIAARNAVRLDPMLVRLVGLPARYVAGEESALVNFVNGGPAKPTFTPPRPFERGVGRRPTLIQNTETLAHIALIARFGADWFRELGTDDEPGSTLLTVSGAVHHASVCEVALGTSVADAVAAAGGPTQEISAFLVGGYFGSWVSADSAWNLPLTNAALRGEGAVLGTGVVYAFPAGHCGLLATAQVARYLAGETAGQCGPCVYGLAAIADALAHLGAGRKARAMPARLHQLFDEVRGRGACRFPDGVIRLVDTALKVFADDVQRHAAHGRCLLTPPPPMPVPSSDGRWQ
jgi:NADH:ubiquinone oxidoreductase subunit F (NADH-binding)